MDSQPYLNSDFGEFALQFQRTPQGILEFLYQTASDKGLGDYRSLIWLGGDREKWRSVA